MKNTLRLFSLLLLSMMLVLSMAGCSGSGDAEEPAEAKPDKESMEDMSDEEFAEAIDNGIVYEEEEEGANLHFSKASESDFYGAWESTSGQSIYMYGNVDLNIKSGGKWTGNVAEEDLSGTWTMKGGSMILESEYFHASLSFTTDGKLIMQEDRSGGEDNNYINTVLTRK